VTVSFSRLVGIAALVALAIAGVGFGIEVVRFGMTDAASVTRLERDVRQRFADSARRTETLARDVARQGELVALAASEPSRLPALFTRLASLTRPVGSSQPSTTVYVPVGPAGQYRVLAWSDGPAEDLPADRLSANSGLFIARGTVGLRVVFPVPIEHDGRRVGIATAETILSPETPLRSGRYELTSSLGPVAVAPVLGDAGETQPRADRFVVTGPSGAPLLEVRFSTADLARRRQAMRARVFALASLPVVALLPLVSLRLLERRRRARSAAEGLGWSAAAAVVLAASGAALTALLIALGAPSGAVYALIALTALGLTVQLVVSRWWSPGHRVFPEERPVRFALEHLGAGLVLAAALVVMARVFESRIAPETLATWQYPLVPLEASNLLYLTGLLLIQLAIGWTAAAVIAMLAERWRISWKQPGRAALAAVLWVVPTAIVMLPAAVRPAMPVRAWVAAAMAAVIFGLVAASVRGRYRRTSQAMRLLVLFAALLIPPFAFYPMGAVFAERATRSLIETDYAPLTAQQAQRLSAELARTQQEIDALPDLATLVSGESPARSATPGARVSDTLAYELWKQTSLGRIRATSEIELFGADGALLSHFALNVPEFDTADAPARVAWRGTNCQWAVFAEGVRFGAEERTVFNAERGICDANDHIAGAVVVRAVLDYGVLPFVASTSPYYDVLGESLSERAAPRLQDLQVVVYGWSLHPLFRSGPVAWPIGEDVVARHYASRDPFWTTLSANRREYAVYFQNDRTSLYALGYPAPTLRDHTTRLAEIAAVVAGLFVALLAGAALYAPLVPRRQTPLRVLFDEIRQSFHRKIFLFFVLAAVGPVLLFALAFGAYMTTRLREDVKSEAASVVSVARRVFQEIAASEPASERNQPPPTDEVMLWIRQVIDQDVNLYVGSQLAATSQRNLFTSGLLPTRTPAAVYREIALNRLPVYVEEDRSGAFHYLVAASAVPNHGPDAVLSVPLALRQREIEREIDELNRGVLLGAVLVVLFAANLGAAISGKFSDRVAGLTRATRLIAAGRLDVRVPVDSADELGRLGDDFNSMSATLAAQRAELARTNQIKAWAEMARQVAHEIKNPLTPIQLAAEHLQRVHDDERRPLGKVFDQCVSTVLKQVRLLRQIASEFANFAGDPTPRPAALPAAEFLEGIVNAYRLGLGERTRIDLDVAPATPPIWADRTLVARAITNLVENAVQAMPGGGTLTVSAATAAAGGVVVIVADQGVGMDAESLSRAFEPYFSTKTAGSGLGLANAKRNIERSGGTIAIASEPGVGTTVTVVLPSAPPPGVAIASS
jgi:signal transduction histidine kinase